MQTLVQVICKNGPSLRDIIANDPKLSDFDFSILLEKKPGRAHGWLKLRSNRPDSAGTINVQWHHPSNVLICRVVNKGEGQPHPTIGAFVNYLLARPRIWHRIQAINVIPR